MIKSEKASFRELGFGVPLYHAFCVFDEVTVAKS